MFLDAPDQSGPAVVLKRIRVLDREGRVSGLIDEEREATAVTPVPPDVERYEQRRAREDCDCRA
jgi:hypothetical protein